eukprot:GHVT01040306.1.p1 GENE.GHVT01040306.1~~GHVT01040306.1.p1  ORF type:complete len:136 (-),score=15.72 GHVT01040306.1:605-1012(-)
MGKSKKQVVSYTAAAEAAAQNNLPNKLAFDPKSGHPAKRVGLYNDSNTPQPMCPTLPCGQLLPVRLACPYQKLAKKSRPADSPTQSKRGRRQQAEQSPETRHILSAESCEASRTSVNNSIRTRHTCPQLFRYTVK